MLVSGARILSPRPSTLPPGERLLLAVDQLEELFTACRSATERAAFAATLARAAADPAGRALVVVALRAVFYRRSRLTRGSPSCWVRTTCWSRPCRPPSCVGVSSCPPAAWACGWSPSWPTRSSMTSRASRARCAPVHCTARALGEAEDNALTLAAYRESGGVHGAVARLAESTYAASPTAASSSCAPSRCAWSARAKARRTRRCAAALHSPSSTWSATRTWPTCLPRSPTAAS